jgi:hypothetical protein
MIHHIFTGIDSQNVKARQEMRFKELDLHMDNALACNSQQMEDRLDRLCLNITRHLAHSPDIFSCDFWFFGFLKAWLNKR